MMDFADFYRKQVEYYKEQIKWTNRQIEWYTEELKRDRAEDRELMEYVWSKGPLTRSEMNIFNSNYKSTTTKRDLKQRAMMYRWRKKYGQYVDDYTRKLEAMDC